jgi:hypothetical protein
MAQLMFASAAQGAADQRPIRLADHQTAGGLKQRLSGCLFQLRP